MHETRDSAQARFEACLAPLTTPEEMRQWDADSVRMGVPGEMLMENAAQSALRVLLEHVPDVRGLECALLMGAGNNGGDAACLSRMLLDHGARVTVWHTRPLDQARGDTAFHARLALACGVAFRPASEFDGRCDILVDGLLGTGFAGELRQDMLDLVRLCNSRSRRCTLGLDIPSGLNAVTGRPGPEAVVCDATATFAAAKPGLVLPWAARYTGRLHVCYIGTPARARAMTPASYALLDADCLRLLADVPAGAWKNVYGHVYVAGGAHGMAGAAHIAGLAALRGGAGLVTAVTPAAGTGQVKNGRAEIMTCEAGPGGDWPERVPALLRGLDERAAIVAGPGMGRGIDAGAFMDSLLATERACPMVIDADGLWHLAAHPEWRARLKPCDILTPHAGEARRLLNSPDMADRPAAARALAETYGCVCVLKGDVTLIAAPGEALIIHPLDVPQLSCGGSGDCLAGLCGALAARGLPSRAAAGLAVAWHAQAGRLLAATHPLRGNLAGEIADALPATLARALHRA